KGMKRSRYLAKQNGENPYEAEFLYQPGTPKKYVEGGTKADGSKYEGFYSQSRRLKSHEKESYKNTGTLNHKDYMPKKDYAILSSANKNAKKFKDHLNISSWDGIKTARENQRTGKHLSNAFEFVKGGAKDILLDPVADAIKIADYLGSTTVAGIAGLAEDSGNLYKAIADPKRDLKYYSKGKSYLKENLKSNFDSLNKTGSGQSMSKYLHEARQRGFEENYNLLKEQGRYKDAEEYKKNYEKETPVATRVLNVTGFVGDLAAPSTLENIAFGVGKGLVKNTAKSFKDMVKGTADLSTGILPEETAKLMAKAQKYTGKASGSSDDVFYSGKKATSKVDKLLDNNYEKVLVRDNLKENFKIPKLTKYLEKIMSNSGKDTLYAKEIDSVKDLARDVSKNKKNVNINDSQKYNLPSSNYNVDTHVKKDPELKKYGYDKGNRYYEDYDVEFFKEVDRWQNILDKDPDNRLKNIERMKKYNKEVYDYMQQVVEDDIGVFNAEEFLNNLNKKNNVKEDITPTDLPKAQESIYPKEQYVGKEYINNHYWVGPEELGNNFDESIKNINDINKTYNKFNKKVLDSKFHNTQFTKVPGKIKKSRKTLNSKTDKASIKNIEKINDMNTEIAVEKLLNIMNKSNQKAIPSNNARKFEFGKNISSITENIINGTFDTEGFKKIKDNVLNDITVNQKIEYLNSVLFGGQEVITKRANKKNIDMFVKSIDEINEASKIISHFEETGEMLPIKLSQETKDFLKIPKNKQIKVTDKKVAGKVVDNPQDIITVLTNALINRSGSLTDARYIEKQQLLANKYGYKKLQYVKDEVNEIKKKLKALDKQTMIPSVLAQKQELSARRKQLQELIDNRQYDWDNILKSMNETTFDDYIAKEHPDIMDRLEFYKKQKQNQMKDSNKISSWSNPNVVNKDFRDLRQASAIVNRGKRMNYKDFVKSQYQTMTLKDKALSVVEWKKEINRRWKEYNLDIDGAVDERGLELVRGEKMRNQIRDGASSIKNNNVGQNSRARQEVLNEVDEYAANKYTTQELHKMRHDKKM
ncbi:MAG: hypothetical protein IJH34_06070, partial [Romboutsia sp.]|nr:hypothetical protein [Romboutsia sp.]